jgi:hypothetical protein
MSASKLHAELFAVLDRVIETGEPAIVERKGRRLRIAVEDATGDAKPAPRRKQKWPTPHPEWIVGDPNDFVNIDWSKEWKP